MSAAWIALGSNLQHPPTQLQNAVTAIANLPHSQLQQVSGAYTSSAIGPGKQADYLNAVLHLETGLEPLDLLDALQAIEQQQGRVRSLRWGPRTLDLDILLYGDKAIASTRLTIPHPAMAQRNFVLYPLAEIADVKMVLPEGEELGTLIARCPRGDLRRTDLRLDTKR